MPKVKKTKCNSRYVPYASGFKPPNKQIQTQAIGFDGIIPIEYTVSSDESDITFFKPIPQPTSIDDWLAQYDEDGQTYKQFLLECPWLSTRKRKSVKQKFVSKGKNILEKYPDGKIYIVPVGEFDSYHYFYFDELAKFAELYLGIPVCTLPGIDIEINFADKMASWTDKPSESNHAANNKTRTSSRIKQHKLESRFNGNQYQLGVGDMLRMLRNRIPNDAVCFIGLTMSDLFCDETDLFVAGMAAGNHRVAIFSFYRYNPQLSFSQADWYHIDINNSVEPGQIKKLMFQRSCKLLVHEINHILGIDHCIFFDCCMNGSGHLSEDFRQPMHLCPVDLHKLQTLVGFNVLDRYQNLLQFYKKHEMKVEEEWISKRIKFITK